jgi:Ni/Fe-hydrogenase subunit HybB-like protein
MPVAIHRFVVAASGTLFKGGRVYRSWLVRLALLIALGAWNYSLQLRSGLVVTGMSDQVSWGFYIANFAFLVGIAAAAVLLVIPAFIFHRQDVKAVVLIGDSLAFAAVIGALTFVIVDIGRPDRLWHMLPWIGRFNFPTSMLAWDVVVLSGYLALNVTLPGYVLYCHFRGGVPAPKAYFPAVVLSIFWAISIHTVTAFLFASSSARPFWNIALLAPRFIATAFVSGPALIILVLQILRRFANFSVRHEVIDMLAVIMGIALWITLYFLGAEFFTDFYNEGRHAASLHYLYFGLHGHGGLRPFVWTALALNAIAVVILSINPLRHFPPTLNLACVLVFIGIWLEKGMGLVVPGFIPTPLGEVFEYRPTAVEFGIAIGVWALAALAFTLAARVTVAVELGEIRDAGPRAHPGHGRGHPRR